MIRIKSAPLLFILVAVFGQPAMAACPSDAAIDAYLAEFAKRQPSKGFGNDISLEDAECAKRKLGKKLPVVLGAPIGYKAAFVNPALQQRFGINGPKWGFMYDRNMVDIIAVLPHDFGARPQFEADLIVEVKDAGLADAKTPLEALAHLESVVPFIELPDLMLEGQFSGNNFIAANTGFRGGVTGMELPVQRTQAFADAMANMTVVMIDEADGNKELGRAKGSALMDNPLHAAIWLAKALKKEGITLKKGDLLSLGGFFPPLATKPGIKARLQYLGLPGDPAVTVEFN
jgi:2-oxo-hept-3-ene-1,7-dioate hydratase